MLLADARGSTTIEKIIIIGLLVFGAAAGVRVLSRDTTGVLGEQGRCVASGRFDCGRSDDVNSGAADPARNLGSMCFVAGTLVATRQGLQPIETITAGTEVLARNDAGKGEAGWKPVLQTFRSTSRSLVRLTTVDRHGREDVIETTGNHPFFTETSGWVDARELTPGRDLLVDAEGQPVRLTMAESVDRQETVYNFEVADHHTYYVGHAAIWVHNRPAAVGDEMPIHYQGQTFNGQVVAVRPNGTIEVMGVRPDGQPFVSVVNRRGNADVLDSLVGRRFPVRFPDGRSDDVLVVGTNNDGTYSVESNDGRVRRSGTMTATGQFVDWIAPPPRVPYRPGDAIGGIVPTFEVVHESRQNYAGEQVTVAIQLVRLGNLEIEGPVPGVTVDEGPILWSQRQNFAPQVLTDLNTIAQTQNGQALLASLQNNTNPGRPVRIVLSEGEPSTSPTSEANGSYDAANNRPGA
ncbi:MAG TPA: polymorphic toxin-type HINT domain-containing protein, partial [Polyangia bacterium]